jgi:hypothetical protein
MLLQNPNRCVKSTRDPANLDEVIAAEAQSRDFIRRVDTAICTLYQIRGYRKLVADLPRRMQAGATALLDMMEELASEPLIEWWCRTRNERLPQ